MPSQIKSTKKSNPCPVCANVSGHCKHTDTELVLCAHSLDAASTPEEWQFLGLTKGGGQWGKIVPSGHPETGKARALRLQRAAERVAIEAARMARLKPKQQRHTDYQYQIANCPITEADRTDLIRRGLTDEDIAKLSPINDGRGGYIIPIRDKDGLMVGGQRRLPITKGKYRWATTGENQLPETVELPLAHWKGADAPSQILLMEGTGIKPYLASKRLNVLAIGAAGGSFGSSPKTLKATLDRYSDLPVVLVPDGGAVANKLVMGQYLAAYTLVKDWGRDMSILWWGQVSKADGDIDEIGPDVATSNITWDEFVAIATPALESQGDSAEFLAMPPEPMAKSEKSGESEKEEKDTISDKARKLAESRCEFFHSSDGIAYTDIIIDGHRHTYPVRSRRFRLWLIGEFLEEYDKGINSQSMQDCLSTLESIAIFRNPERAVYLRKAELDGKIYIDLGSEDWSAIEVNAIGWGIIPTPPVRFWRPETMLPLPTPTHGGKLNDLRELLNVDNDSWVLISSFLLFCFCPSDVYPVLVLFAPRGSGKTTAAEVLKDLVDPGKGGLLDLPTDSRALAVNAIRRSLLVYDNVSYIGNDSSDLVCKVATGFSLGVRTLHSNDEETTFDILRPQIITAIDAIVTRDDLADRVLMAQLLPISEEKRLPQAEVRAKIEELKPGILGALMTALSQSLAKVPEVRAKAKAFPRLADYALFATAAEESIGIDDGKFREVFDRSREESRQIVIEASPVAEAIIALVRAELGWKGTPTELLNKLEKFAEPATVKSRTWPKASNSLSQKLTRLKPDLECVGISIVDSREPRTGIRKLTIEKILQVLPAARETEEREKTSSPSSPPSEPLPGNGFSGDDRGDDRGDDSGGGDDVDDAKKSIVTASSPLKPLPGKGSDGGDDGDDKNSRSSLCDGKTSGSEKTLEGDWDE
jgi:hypothetical protein